MKKPIMRGMAVVLSLASSATFAAGEVQLQDVSSFVNSIGGLSLQQVRIEAVVKNLAPNKRVFARYKQADGQWVDSALRFDRMGAHGFEVWTGYVVPPHQASFDVEFALGYVVNGATYWDNNGGANHAIARDAGPKLASGVHVDWLFPSEAETIRQDATTIPGAVSVRNLGTAKNVTVWYSTDRWATTRTARASMAPNFWRSVGSSAASPNAHGIEVWTYSLDIGQAVNVDFAFEYEVDGQKFWDNNLGQNYQLFLNRQ